MRSDTHTINGLSAKKLLTSNTTSFSSVSINAYDGDVYVTQYIGIKIWKRDENGNETPIASLVVAIANSDVTALVSATWYNSSQQSLGYYDAVVVRVYANDYSPPTTLKATFITEQLGAQSLDVATWTVRYHIYRRMFPVDTDAVTEYQFRFGSSGYNSRIENFTWTVGTPPQPSQSKQHSGTLMGVGIF
jgi:hypothetical protein